MKEYINFIRNGNGDVTGFSDDQISILIKKICDWFGLNQDFNPIQVITTSIDGHNSKTILYANKNCTDQLSLIYQIDITSTHVRFDEITKCYVASCKGFSKKLNKWNVAIGALKEVEGMDRGYQIMWASTRAKRRCILGLVGLSLLGEEEVTEIKIVEN